METINNDRFTPNDIYLRPLKESDAYVSYKWRNNKAVWEHTYSCPNCQVTVDMELEWIRRAINEKDSLRFAICLKDGDKYVGNVYLTRIDWSRKCGSQGTFIGDPELWGKGIGTLARMEMHRLVHEQYGINLIRTKIKCENVRSLRSALKAGFVEVERKDENVILEKRLGF